MGDDQYDKTPPPLTCPPLFHDGPKRNVPDSIRARAAICFLAGCVFGNPGSGADVRLAAINLARTVGFDESEPMPF